MPTYSRPLHSALAPYISSCVGYDYQLSPEAQHHGLPSPGLTVILAFGRPLDCGWLDGDTAGQYWVLIGGLHDRPALIRTHGDQRGMQLQLTPAGSRRLLGTPAGPLVRSLLDRTDLPTAFPEPLHAELAEADWPARFTVLERHLLRRLEHCRPDPCPDALTAAWSMITTSQGSVRIDEVAAEVGWSRRHLLTRFRSEYGFGPKQIGRLARFRYAHQLAQAGVPLAAVAYRSGYADQAHLNREWRSFAGQSPRQTLGEFPSIQEPLP